LTASAVPAILAGQVLIVILVCTHLKDRNSRVNVVSAVKCMNMYDLT